MGIFGGLYVLTVAGKVAVFGQRLSAQLYSVHQENHFIGIFGLGNELCRFKAGHSFARTCGMPNITTQAIWVIRAAQLLPVGFGYLVGYGIGGVILITAHHLKHAIGVVGNGVKAN